MYLTSSEFIQTLLQLPSTQPISEALIHLEHDADTVRHYVNYATSAKDHEVRLSLVGYQNLLDVCDHLQSPAIELSVLVAIKARMDSRIIREISIRGRSSRLPPDETT